jgi:alanyl-tRNA synthetase
MTEEEIDAVEDLVNAEVLRNEPVRIHETTRQEAEAAGAMAFFGDKYGAVVRVVEAGASSIELCGGTHVNALGAIGPLRIVSEASIGSNTRRIEAVTGAASIARFRLLERTAERAAERLRTQPLELEAAIERLLASERTLEQELGQLRSGQLRQEAEDLAGQAAGGSGVVVARRDGLEAGKLRDLAIAVRNHASVKAVGLVGVTGPERVGLVVAAKKGSGIDAREAAAVAAAAVGGGGGGSPELATAGGRDVAGISEALEKLAEVLGRQGAPPAPEGGAPA